MKQVLVNKIAVIGLGNILLKDDGIGVWLIRELQKTPLTPVFEVFDVGTSVFAIPSLVKGYSGVLIADALNGGGKPGSFYTFSREEIIKHCPEHRKNFMPHSLHDFHISDPAALPDLAGYPGNFRVFGVEPAHIEFGYGLSGELSDKLCFLTIILRNEAEKMSNTRYEFSEEA